MLLRRCSTNSTYGVCFHRISYSSTRVLPGTVHVYRNERLKFSSTMTNGKAISCWATIHYHSMMFDCVDEMQAFYSSWYPCNWPKLMHEGCDVRNTCCFASSLFWHHLCRPLLCNHGVTFLISSSRLLAVIIMMLVRDAWLANWSAVKPSTTVMLLPQHHYPPSNDIPLWPSAPHVCKADLSLFSFSCCKQLHSSNYSGSILAWCFVLCHYLDWCTLSTFIQASARCTLSLL